MFFDEVAEAIGRAHGTALDDITRRLWAAHAAGQCNDDDATRLSEAIQARRMLAKAAQSPASGLQRGWVTFPTRKPQRPPERSVAIERRRRLAASGPMPPALASRFTTSEAAVLRIVGDECRERGRCDLCLDAIAARAGVGRTTAQKALREAKILGMIEIRERPRVGAKNDTNLVTVVDREWRQWLERSPKRAIGFGKTSTTETSSFRKEGRNDRSADPRDDANGGTGFGRRQGRGAMGASRAPR